MSEERTPLFLERQSYRRRRLIDMIRVLPIIGTLLWAVPLLWPTDPEHGIPASVAIIYLFGVWLVLVLVGAVLARLLKKAEAQDSERAS